MRALISGLAAVAIAAAAAPSSQAGGGPASLVCAACVKANLERLAGDDLHGRKCGSDDEHAAAALIAEQLRAYGVKGGFDGGGGYLQPVQLLTPTYATPPVLEISSGGASLRLTHGQEMLVSNAPIALDAPIVRVAGPSAPLVRVAALTGSGPNLQGKAVIYDAGADNEGASDLLKAGADLVILRANAAVLRRWNEFAQRPPERTDVIGAGPHDPPTGGTTVAVRPEVFDKLAALSEGGIRLSAPRGPAVARGTYNVVGVIHGRARDADRHAILLSAHYDHLGVRNGVIFHGADDDASGTVAVLEFARILGSGRPPKRTVYFALFGCEEEGELGAQYFQAHPPQPLYDLAANLEFEMIGVDDPKQPGALMLTGWERSNLGPMLKAHGALIGPDPYPEQHFFQRSDNYQLALSGVVAQTVTAWPLTPTYHSPSDDLAHVDLPFMDQVIGSLVAPVQWLLNSDFQPSWNPGQRP